MAFATKTYIVQKADREGVVSPDILAVKFTITDAHAIAKRHAPARVTTVLADKGDLENGPGQIAYRGAVQLIAQAG